MRYTFWTKIVAPAMALLASTQAVAEGRVCVTNIGWTGVDPTGSTVVYFKDMGVATLCNLNGTVNTTRGAVSSETCKGWYAGFTTAYARNVPVALWFDYGTSAAPQCNAMNFDWTVPANYPYLVTFYPQ